MFLVEPSKVRRLKDVSFAPSPGGLLSVFQVPNSNRMARCWGWVPSFDPSFSQLLPVVESRYDQFLKSQYQLA